MVELLLLRRWAAVVTTIAIAVAAIVTLPVHALDPLPTPPPESGSFGLEATKKQAPPTQGATISAPGNGASFSASPVTVSGICPAGLLVQVYNNGVMVGSTICERGSFTMQITLFVGQNELSASVFDDLGQAGPASDIVTIAYNNASITAFGSLITLTSNFGRRAASPGAELTWPLLLSGGRGPYAFSIDWGDGTPSELKSQNAAGTVDISHVYRQAGVYPVLVRVTDVDGVTAFLQLVAVANGEVTKASQATDDAAKTTAVQSKVMIWPTAFVLALLLPTYWLGRRSEFTSIRHGMQRDFVKDSKAPKKPSVDKS